MVDRQCHAKGGSNGEVLAGMRPSSTKVSKAVFWVAVKLKTHLVG